MKEFYKFIGLEPSTTSHTEKWVSAVGGFAGVILTVVICRYFLGAENFIVVASLGASAVLVFALPHVNVAQPWPLIGGQFVSACVGVTCAKYIPDITLAASMAVGIAILAMYYLGCIHPPGGATALAAVISGPEVHALGYQFVVTPIFVTAFVLLILAIVINFAFHWRRYPMHLMQRLNRDKSQRLQEASMFTSEDLQLAMKELDMYFDVSEEDLTRLVNLAVNNYQKAHLLPSQIRLGKYYSNGRSGDQREIRHVVDESSNMDAAKDMVIYKVVSADKLSTSSEVISRIKFAKWARYEVRKTEQDWERLD